MAMPPGVAWSMMALLVWLGGPALADCGPPVLASAGSLRTAVLDGLLADAEAARALQEAGAAETARLLMTAASERAETRLVLLSGPDDPALDAVLALGTARDVLARIIAAAMLADAIPPGPPAVALARALALFDWSAQAWEAPAGSAQAGSAQAGSGQAGSAQAGSGQAGSGQAGSGQAGSGQAETARPGCSEAARRVLDARARAAMLWAEQLAREALVPLAAGQPAAVRAAADAVTALTLLLPPPNAAADAELSGPIAARLAAVRAALAPLLQ